MKFLQNISSWQMDKHPLQTADHLPRKNQNGNISRVFVIIQKYSQTKSAKIFKKNGEEQTIPTAYLT